SLWDRYLAYLSHLLLVRPRALACNHPDDRTMKAVGQAAYYLKSKDGGSYQMWTSYMIPSLNWKKKHQSNGLDIFSKFAPNILCEEIIVLTAQLPDHVQMDIEDEETGAIRIERVTIKYDYLAKYYKECRLQDQNEDECRMLHLEFIQQQNQSKSQIEKPSTYNRMKTGGGQEGTEVKQDYQGNTQ
ncbi:hypothetical protein HAX54_033484, partial [Datura stramonium]|nr:hypothetical protein [Datura stramonium]